MSSQPTVFIVEDDPQVLKALALSLRKRGMEARAYPSAELFLESYDPQLPGCLVLDLRLSGMSGLELQRAVRERGIRIPIIFISGHGDIPSSVQAIKGGAVDFLEKPVRPALLLERIDEALQEDALRRQNAIRNREIKDRFETLTSREREVLQLLIAEAADTSSKMIAKVLGISPRTVESHRARIMAKTKAQSIADLAAMARIHADESE